MAVGRDGIAGLRISGKVGNVVFARYGDALIVREYVIPRNPRTAAQIASRNKFAQASLLWKGLTPAQFDTWQAFSATQKKAPYLVFMSLTRKWLAVNPSRTPPLTAPTAPFVGDASALSVVGTPSGLTLTSNLPSSAGVMVEVLVQRLANTRRATRARNWSTAGFVNFAAGHLSVPVALAPGAYAVAYRFVLAATGQFSEQLVLGSIQVG